VAVWSRCGLNRCTGAANPLPLSVFRSWDFDAAVIVFFDDDFRVWRAARVPVEAMQDGARFVQHVRGYRVLATDTFLDRSEDWTERLRAVER
jgi:hypothetical protein